MKIACDDFYLHCMERREYDEEGRCKICHHIIHRQKEKSDKEGYNELKSESNSSPQISQYSDI